MTTYNVDSVLKVAYFPTTNPVYHPLSNNEFFLPSNQNIFWKLQTPVDFLIFPPNDNIIIECRNDMKIRRRKMKKHQKDKWTKTHGSYITKTKLEQEKKQEDKLQELFTFWRIRSDAWNPKEKVDNRLHFARRSGYHVNILETDGSPLLK